MGEIYYPPVTHGYQARPFAYATEGGSVYVFGGREFSPPFALALRRIRPEADGADDLAGQLSEEARIELIRRFDDNADSALVTADNNWRRTAALIESGGLRIYRLSSSELTRVLNPEDRIWGGVRSFGVCEVGDASTRETLNETGVFRSAPADAQQRIVANVNEIQNLGYPEVQPVADGVAAPISDVEAFFTFNPVGQGLRGLSKVPGNLLEGGEEVVRIFGDVAIQAPVYYLYNATHEGETSYEPKSAAGRMIDHYGWGEGSARLFGNTVHGLLSPVKAFYEGDPEGVAEGFGEYAVGFGVGKGVASLSKATAKAGGTTRRSNSDIIGKNQSANGEEGRLVPDGGQPIDDPGDDKDLQTTLDEAWDGGRPGDAGGDEAGQASAKEAIDEALEASFDNTAATDVHIDNPYFVRIDPNGGQGSDKASRAIDTSSFSTGTPTKNGGLRSNRKFWKKWLEQHPESLSDANKRLIENQKRSPIVDDKWVEKLPEHSGYEGETLIHHHLDYGPNAIPLPESTHDVQPGKGIWHPEEWGNQ